MSEALTELQARIAQLDERDDQIVALVTDLRSQVGALQLQIAAIPNIDVALQDAADKIAESLTKFDAVLAPVAVEPAPVAEPAVELTPVVEPVVEPAVEPVAEPTPSAEPSV